MSGCIRIDPLTPAIYVGRGAHWDAKTSSLYCVDMFKGTVHSYNALCDRFCTATVGCATQKPLAAIIPIDGKKDTFILSLKNDLTCIKWDGVTCQTSEPKVIQSLEPHDSDNRINTAKVDPKGRLWAGTTGRRLSDKELIYEEGVAALYSLKGGGTVQKMLDCVSVAAGMEWSIDKRFFYFIDSAKFQLDVFDYCNEAGKICNPRIVMKMKDNNMTGTLDGMCQDCDGKLYIANYLGAQIAVYDPKVCKIVNIIKIPAKEVTSLCWGGPENDILFVTTGNSEPSPKYPCAGRIFKVVGIGAKGVPPRSVVLK